jgi:ribosome maturation factor RimP
MMAVSELDQRRSLETRITELAEQVAASMEMEIVLIEIKGDENRSVVRAYIDKPNGITLDDCEKYSKRFSVVLDVEDWITFSYVLEVSSPGINRPLVKKADFERFTGKEAKVKTRRPVDGQRNFKGKLSGVRENSIELEIVSGKRISIELMDIEKANLIGEINMRPQGS